MEEVQKTKKSIVAKSKEEKIGWITSSQIWQYLLRLSMAQKGPVLPTTMMIVMMVMMVTMRERVNLAVLLQ
jgi:hypothetical protein